jgi:hypothetical protein
MSDVEWLIFCVRHADFEKHIAKCSVKMTNNVDIENVNKLCIEQI